jgi:hypothetical protein
MYCIEDLQFPVLIAGRSSEDFNMELTSNPQHLKVTTKLSIKEKTLENCLIFDSNGRIFNVKSVQPVKRVSPLWKFTFFNPMYHIELDLGFVGVIESLDDLKVRVSNSIDQSSEIWAENFELTRLKRKLKSAKNIKKIIDAITKIE